MSDVFPQLLQQCFNGLSLGAIYALIAIGYTVVYGIIGMINFAHGEIFMVGAYVGIVALAAMGASMGTPVLTVVLMVGVAIIVSVLITGTFGFTTEKVAYRPLRQSPRLVALISAIGVSIALQNYVALGQGSKDLAAQSLVAGGYIFHVGNFDINISYGRLMIIFVTVVLMLGLTLFIKYSRTGRASRACSQDLQMANLLGIDTNKIISSMFVLGAVLASVGGVLFALTYIKVNPFIGFLFGIKAFTAAVLGGIGSIPGAMLGAVILGLAETFTAAYISAEYKDIVAFSLLVLILLFRPTGLLGKPEVEKV